MPILSMFWKVLKRNETCWKCFKIDLLSGSSNLGISEPCHFTSITLNVIISNLILKEPPSIEYLSNAKLYLKLQQEIDTILENIELKLLNDGAT